MSEDRWSHSIDLNDQKNTSFPWVSEPQSVRPKCDLFFPSMLVIVLFVIIGMVQEFKIGNYNALAASDSPPDFNFAAVGDIGCTEDSKNTVNNILNRDPELIFGLGDYSYDNSADCWFNIVDPIDEKMKIAIGNHDIVPPKLNPLMLHFNLSEQFYSFDYQTVHFLIMSTEIPFHTGSEQFEFVDSDLSKAVENPDTDWIFVIIHKPLYSSPSSKSSISNSQDPLRTTYHPLFDKYGVDSVIQSHFHIYERTYPLNFNSLSIKASLTYPQIVDATNSNNYTNPKGPVFVTVGTGGASLHEIEGTRPYIITQYRGFGILDVAVLKDGSTIDARFYANNGSIIDEFTIMKTNSSNNSETATQSLYHYVPYIALSGSNYTDIEIDASPQLTQFSVATWFNVDSYSAGRNYIVNSANYGIWIEDDGRVRASYQTNDGDIVMTSSSHRYDDNRWHYAVTTYDGFFFRLYIDNILTAYRPSASPPEDEGIERIRIGGPVKDGSFIGRMDELRIWNRALPAKEIEQGHSLGIFDSTGQVLYLPDLMKLNARTETR